VLACVSVMQMAERWQLAAQCWLAACGCGLALRDASGRSMVETKWAGHLGGCAVLLTAVVLLGWAGPNVEIKFGL
jgi:hypothetical protein